MEWQASTHPVLPVLIVIAVITLGLIVYFELIVALLEYFELAGPG